MRLTRSLFAVVILLLLIFAPKAESAPLGDRVSEAGEKLTIAPQVRFAVDGVRFEVLNSDYEWARRFYEISIKCDTTYAPAKYQLAKMLLYQSADSAMTYARSAYLSDTTNRWYLSVYAQSLVGVERYDEAMEFYEKYLVMQPRDLNAYRILAILYNRNKEPEKAIAVLDSAEVRAGRNDYLLALKRQVLLSANKVDRAIEETKALVEETPYSADYRVALADLYASQMLDSLARVEYEEAIRIDSTRLDALIPYAEFLANRGEMGEYISVMGMVVANDALSIDRKVGMLNEMISNKSLYRKEYLKVGDLIRSLLIQSPENQKVIKMQAQHLISMGMVEDALSFLKRHLDDGEPNLSNYRMVIEIEQYLNRADSVDLYLSRAVKLFPEQRSLRFEYAGMLTSKGRYDEAVECYLSEVDGAADSLKSMIYGSIGDVYLIEANECKLRGDVKCHRKLVKKCGANYRKSYKFDPHNLTVLNNYAYFISENGGDLEFARNISKRTIESEPSSPTFLDTYAWVLFQMGEYTEAKVVMRQAISFDTTQNPEIALHYAEILAALGEETMAQFYWSKAEEWGMIPQLIEESRARADRRGVAVEKE